MKTADGISAECPESVTKPVGTVRGSGSERNVRASIQVVMTNDA